MALEQADYAQATADLVEYLITWDKKVLADRLARELVWKISEDDFTALARPPIDSSDDAKRDFRRRLADCVNHFEFISTKRAVERAKVVHGLARSLKAAPATAAERARAARAAKREQRRLQIHAFLETQTFSDTNVLADLLRKAFPRLKKTTAPAEVRAWKKKRKKDLQLRATEKPKCRDVPQMRSTCD